MRCVVLINIVLLSSPAWAQDEPPSEPPTAPEPAPEPAPDTVGLAKVMDVARTKAERGLALFAAKQWQQAYEHFDVANQLFSAPTLVMYMGHCKREVGSLLEARALYQRVTTARVPAEAPPAYLEAQATAKAELEKLRGRIPQVRIVVTGMPRAQVKATLDGEPVQLDPAMVDVDPGPHVIEARGPRAEPVERSVMAVEGQAAVVQIALMPIAPERVVTTIVAEGPPVGLAPPIVFAAVGAAGFVVGGVAGAVVLAKVADLETECGGFTCPTALRADRDDTKPIATLSTVGFIVGGIGVATAAVLFPLHFLGGDDDYVAVGPGQLSVRCAF